MDIGLIIVMTICSLLLLVVILSFLGPEDRQSGFWYVIQRIKHYSDLFWYWFYTVAAGCAVFGSVGYGIYKWIAGQ